MYPHPFSVGYWRTAANELKDVRKLTFAALCIALCMALAAIPSVPLWGGAKITWGFLARAVCAWVCGPVLGVVFAVAEDLLSFFITGGGGCQEYFNMMKENEDIWIESSLYSPLMVKDAVDMALDVLAGKDVEPVKIISTTVVDRDNVDEYLDPENTVY